MPDQTPLHQITYPLGTDRADIRVLETMARDVDRELGELHGLNDAEQAKLITSESGTWTPAFGGGFVIGNATVVVNYSAVSSLVTCYLSITAIAGSTTAWGTSYPSITLPFPAYSASSSLLRFTAGPRFIIGMLLSSGSSVANLYSGGAGGVGSSGVGQFPAYQASGASAWGAGSRLYGSVSYRRV